MERSSCSCLTQDTCVSFSGVGDVRENQPTVTPLFPSLTQHRRNSDKTSDLRWWRDNCYQEEKGWGTERRKNKVGIKMGKHGPPRRFILLHPGSLSLLLLNLPPKTLGQAALQEGWRLGDAEDLTACRKNPEEVPGLWGCHSPGTSVGEGLHTSVMLSCPRSWALDKCLRLPVVFLYLISFQKKSQVFL